ARADRLVGRTGDAPRRTVGLRIRCSRVTTASPSSPSRSGPQRGEEEETRVRRLQGQSLAVGPGVPPRPTPASCRPAVRLSSSDAASGTLMDLAALGRVPARLVVGDLTPSAAI